MVLQKPLDETKLKWGNMNIGNDGELDEILEKNPFKLELIKKWKDELQSFLAGRCRRSDLLFVLDSDKDIINEYQKKNGANGSKRLHLELLPQPFQGNPRAPIWLLMLNPSYSCLDRYDHLGMCPSCDKNLVTMNVNLKHDVFDCGKDKSKALRKRQALLLQQLRLRNNYQFSILNNAFNTLQHMQEWQDVGGYRWWRNVLFGSNGKKEFLLPECNVEADAKSVGKNSLCLSIAHIIHLILMQNHLSSVVGTLIFGEI